MMYDNYSFWGMHLAWWFVWIIFILWIFATPYDIPGQRNKKDTPLDVLKKRFAKGEITREQFLENKSTIEKY